MDEADIRRGNPSVHVKYGRNAAILSGDIMLVMAYQHIVTYTDEVKELFSAFNLAAQKVCEGQQFDLNSEHEEDVSIKDYLKTIELKSAVLLAASLKLGAIISGATPGHMEHIYQFGLNIGIAFQLQDDMLDAFGDEKKLGKKIGGDIIQNKKTYLLLKTMELSDSVAKKDMKALMKNTTDTDVKVAGMLAIFNRLDVKQHTSQIIQKYIQAAHDSLEQMNITKERQSVLFGLMDQLINRTH